MFNIFSSYLLIDNFKFDTKKYKKEILDLKSVKDTVTKSNYGGWQSGGFETVPKNFKDLFKKISANVKEVEKKLSLSKELKLHNLWYNVNGLGSFNRPHDHPNCVVSGVYYISIPKNSGSIVFLNENLDLYYRDNIKNFNEYNSSVWKIEPEENKCILFPSYLKHYVEPNLNKKERISISFNYGF
jgi:uncharacterized protein (TIGR02466 family)